MDPLSVTASIIAVLQAASSVLSVCYDYRAAVKSTPWGLAKATEEIRDLRNVLESLETLSKRVEASKQHDAEKSLSTLRLICSEDKSPLNACLLELNRLQKKLSSPKWVNELGRKRRALIQAIGWQIKDREIQESLELLDRYKSSLNLALSADETTMLLELKSLTSFINDGVSEIREDFAMFKQGLESSKLDDRHRALLQWLSPIDPTISHQIATQSHQKGTSEWICHSRDVLDWLGCEGSFLWLSGFPGIGKTVLFSSLVELLQQDLSESIEGARLAYFYCDFRKLEAQDSTNIVGSLVAQLCTQLETFPHGLELAYDQNFSNVGQMQRPSMEMLCSTLKSLGNGRRLVLLVDALDECHNPEELSESLFKLTGEDSSINILVTSRDEAGVRRALSSAKRLPLEAHGHDISEDVHSYIDRRLEDETRLRWLSRSVKADIQNSLNMDSGGMFRWVQCQLDQIAQLKTVRSIRKTLNELPKDLEQTYERILTKISPHYVEHVQKILQWLSFAKSPLCLRELHDAIVIDRELAYLDEEARLSSPDDILDLCNSLINVTEDGTVRLAHLSVKDYLLSANIRTSGAAEYALDTKATNVDLCINCLAYLSIRDFHNGPALTASAFDARTEKFPFLEHAAVCWSYYNREANEPDELHERINQFFDSKNHPQFMAWVQVLNAIPTGSIPRATSWNAYPRRATPLYYASSFGLLRTVNYLIEHRADLDAPGSRFGGTALHGAVLRKHFDVAKRLLDAGANPDKADRNGTPPMTTAVFHENEKMIILLLQHGADRGFFKSECVRYARGNDDVLSHLPYCKELK